MGSLAKVATSGNASGDNAYDNLSEAAYPRLRHGANIDRRWPAGNWHIDMQRKCAASPQKTDVQVTPHVTEPPRRPPPHRAARPGRDRRQHLRAQSNRKRCARWPLLGPHRPMFELISVASSGARALHKPRSLRKRRGAMPSRLTTCRDDGQAKSTGMQRCARAEAPLQDPALPVCSRSGGRRQCARRAAGAASHALQ